MSAPAPSIAPSGKPARRKRCCLCDKLTHDCLTDEGQHVCAACRSRCMQCQKVMVEDEDDKCYLRDGRMNLIGIYCSGECADV